uniref:Mitochondrial carrier protein n=1 Tax=Spongospora subterranea TaxID=70186 RepID=A0A0H5QI46_9EUKA|eukprot:CRZ01011.1 hypothetical protein [Spongospora subterranea]
MFDGPASGPSNQLESQVGHRFAVSAIAAATAETLTYPLDVTKTQMQIKRRAHLQTKLYPGSTQMGFKEFHSFRRLEPIGFLRTGGQIFGKEGFRGFYKGLPAATLRAVFNNGLSLTMYKPLLRLITGRPILHREKFDSELYDKLAAAFLTGGLSQVMANPVDIIKVRMQAEGLREVPRFRGTLGAIQFIYKTGVPTFWTGLLPSIARSALAVGSTIGTYDHSKHYLERHHGMEEGFLMHCISSITSGLVASISSCPVDVVKTRIMTQSFSRPQYSSVWNCLATIVKTEGVLTLFKGFVPTYMRLGPWQVIFFTTYEQVSVILGGSNI